MSKPGTVRVKSNYEIEYYSHVIHISSQVEGIIRDDLDAVDALVAVFLPALCQAHQKSAPWN